VPPFDRLGIDIESIKSIIPNLKHMKFTGGEPLLIPEYKMILEERAKHKDFNSCFLNYSTNLMHFPDSRLLDLWKKVEYVEIATSFDGIGKVIEYVRYPSKWPVVERNLIKFMELSRLMDIRVGMRSTIMPYNVLDLPNMINWWSEKINKHYRYPFNEFSWINPTHVAQPVFLTLKVLPKNCKDIVRDRIWDKGLNKKVNQSFNHLCNYMDSEDHSHFLDDFRRFTNKMDQRGIKFKDIYPELANEIF
jgi:sulfatase maturation enzyme AslB (radical SAM superfamily)